MILGCLALTAGVLFAGALQEKPAEPVDTIRVLANVSAGTEGGILVKDMFEYRFHQKYPDVAIEWLGIDFSDGSTLTMDAQIGTGTPPDIYVDFWGRAAKYMVEEFALDLTPFCDDWDDYLPGVLDSVTRGGKILGLPKPGGNQAICLNLDLLDSVGYSTDFDNWTIADFLDMCEAVKQGTNGEAYGTAMFASNQSGDYLIRNWGASFGAKFYADGNYEQTAFNDAAAVRTIEFIQTLYERGYVPETAAVINDDDMAIQWGTSQLAATVFYPSWALGYWKSFTDQGIIEGPFRARFVPYPLAEGVERAGVFTSAPGIIVRDSGDAEHNERAAYLAWIMNTPETQLLEMFIGQVVPNRKSLQQSDLWKQAANVAAKNGSYDLGLTTDTFAAIRPIFPRLLQKLFQDQITPEEFVAEYEAEINPILAGE
jgi:ABC-type glycerol-3-phosphate transport system substrate-binding protein|tara:strand:+ start:193 stop:1473 length:1281 start_codon:yes stop_codon:yes gene_type:complete